MYTKKKDKAFYTFEDAAIMSVIGMSVKDNYLSESEILSLMERISRSYGMNTPALKYTRVECKSCYYRALDHTVYLNKRFGCTLLFVLHEMCHPLCQKKYPGHKEDHGAEFVTVWIEVMSRMFDVNPQLFKTIADKQNIKYLV